MFTLEEMVAAFDVVDVNSNPARFDQKKADAINAEHIRRLEPAEFTGRLQAYFDGHGHDTGSTRRASPPPPNWCRPASWCSPTRGSC